MEQPNRRHTDRPHLTLLGVIVLLASLFIIAGVVQADDIIVEGGVNLVFPEEGTDNTSWQFRGGYKNVYATWEWTDEWEHRVLGQEIMETEVNQFGVGFRQDVGPVQVFIEAGVADLDTKYWGPAGDEVSYTYLVGRHDVGDRKIPVPCAYHRCYDSEWELDDNAPFASVGFSWSPVDHVKVQAKYTYLNPEVYVAIKRPDLEEGQGYWEEHDNLDMSSASVGIVLFW